eukprot:m.177253 g.177253  ORF g.177253 m.177253 type:complete len:443 (+) comp31879_c2_seq1:141-1469(+)
MASLGFIANLLIYRDAQRNGEKYGFKYPVNGAQLDKMGVEWLTKALRASKAIAEDVTVTEMKSDKSDINGLLGELRVINVKYSKETDAPPKFMVKFCPTDLKTRGLTALFGLTINEIKFYGGEMSKKVPMRVPKTFYADMNEWTGNSCLILEFVEAEYQDILKDKITLADAKLMITQLARYHAVYVGPEKIKHASVAFASGIDEGASLNVAPKELKKSLKKCYLKQQPCPPDQQWDYEFSEGYVKLFDEVTNSFKLYAQHATRWPEVSGIVHGDPKQDNFFFYNDSDGKRTCGLLDWQMIYKTDVTNDLAWFFCGSGDAQFQIDHEKELLDLYFEEFAQAGGQEITPDSEDRALWEECLSLSYYYCLGKCVLGLADIDTSNPKTVPRLNIQTRNMFAAFDRRDSFGVYKKFRNGEMIIQKRHPEISKQIFANCKQVPTKLFE